MIYYLQRESNLGSTIPSDSSIKFETSIALSETASLTPSADFVYQEDGSIDIMRPGIFTIFWYVASKTGFSTIGQSYQLKKIDYSSGAQDWNPIAGASNHIKVSQTSGFAILIVSQAEINQYGKATVALFNVADASEELTFFIPKAGILISGINFESLQNKLTAIDGQIVSIIDQIDTIEQLIRLSEVTTLYSQTPELSALGAAVINSGYIYNFWGIGTLSHQQTLYEGTVYYLVDISQFEPLSFYQGSSTISTLWIELPAPSTVTYSLPIRFDAAGIYFIPDTTYLNLPAGTAFRFTQTLILVDPEPQP